jgi:hypothetical protein
MPFLSLMFIHNVSIRKLDICRSFSYSVCALVGQPIIQALSRCLTARRLIGTLRYGRLRS